MQFPCECDDPSCASVVEIDDDSAAYIRLHGWAIVLPGHPVDRARDARGHAAALREHARALRAQARLQRARARRNRLLRPRYARIRDQNVRLARIATWSIDDEETYVPFLCECDDEECGESVTLTLGEFDALGSLAHFAAPAHAIATADRTGATPRFGLYLVTPR